MTELAQFASPVVCRRTGLYADHARRQRLEEGRHFTASQLATDDDLAAGVDAVDLEPVLGEVEADGGNVQR
jgi:hypothetical protein